MSESHPIDRPVADKLARAARTAAPLPPGALRPEQQQVVARFEALLGAAVRSAGCSRASRYWRIVLPPRTGKTVVAAHIIARTGLDAVLLVPTRTLVRQVAAELEAHGCGRKLGVLSGERDALVNGGVNVVTYQVLQARLRRGEPLPAALRQASLVFVDEAHHAMTESRTALLAGVFDDEAIRIGLTATPDYGENRRLCDHFPTRIAELGIPEALERGLLAPARAWLAEVDVDASKVRLVGGDYAGEELGEVMSAAPFFRAAELFRYSEDNAARPALLCCASRRQAADLVSYLRKHRPAGSPPPQLVLGDTTPRKRDRILARFERGEVDTLVQVGVLIEGWSSPRCKLLIDLAPSFSRVRATQKYFRVMTPHRGEDAHIYVVLPKNLAELPLLPPDLLGAPFNGYEAGDLLGGGGSGQRVRPRDSPVAGVRLRQRLLLSCPLTPPALERGDVKTLREVLATCPDFHSRCTRRQFRRMLFRHPAFSGSGAFLLAHLGVEDFEDWLAGLDPAAAAMRWLGAEPLVLEEGDLEALRGTDAWLAAGGRLVGAAPSAEDIALRHEEAELARALLASRLRPRDRQIVSARFGLDGCGERMYRTIAATWDISGGRCEQIVKGALHKLQSRFACRENARRRLAREGRLALLGRPSLNPPWAAPR